MTRYFIRNLTPSALKNYPWEDLKKSVTDWYRVLIHTKAVFSSCWCWKRVSNADCYHEKVYIDLEWKNQFHQLLLRVACLLTSLWFDFDILSKSKIEAILISNFFLFLLEPPLFHPSIRIICIYCQKLVIFLFLTSFRFDIEFSKHWIGSWPGLEIRNVK